MERKHKDAYIQMGRKVAQYRKQKGLTQKVLAEKIGKSSAYIGQIEAPGITRAISLDTLFDIAECLEIAPYKLLK